MKESLVACIGEGKGTWGHAARVINDSRWSSVFIVTSEYFSDKFTTDRAATKVVVDKEHSVGVMVEELFSKLKGVSKDVSVNLISGSGKEHMAVLGALFRLGCNVHLVEQGKDGVVHIG